MRWTKAASRLAGSAWLLILVIASTADAVVINTVDDATNRRAPAHNPGWYNAGRITEGSAVYLGNRWVLTANHVSGDAITLADGRVFQASVGPDVRLQNPGGFGGADLRMFRLAEDPLLPSLELATSAPDMFTRVMMIGAGRDIAPPLLGWRASSVSEWAPIPIVFANRLGYAVDSQRHMRWGNNEVSAESRFNPAFDSRTFEFSTRFDRAGTTINGVFEAQAVMGDSGGPVFHQVDGAWQLSGLMLSTTTQTGQPDGTVVFGNSTNAADLSRYREQILELVNRDEPLWQNQVNHYDVDGSGRVDPRDALTLINALLIDGARELDGSPPPAGSRYDVDGDYMLKAGDALAVINYLLEGVPTEAGQGSGANLVPEPSSGVLAALGLLLLVAARGFRRRRAR